MVIIHSFIEQLLLSLSDLEGPGIDVVQGKARPAFWLPEALDLVKRQSLEHTICDQERLKGKEAFTAVVTSSLGALEPSLEPHPQVLQVLSPPGPGMHPLSLLPDYSLSSLSAIAMTS